MEVNKHITFRRNKSLDIIEYLNKNGISFEDGDLIALDILESNPHWAYIEDFAKNNKLLIQSNTIFSVQELESSEWLTLRSIWRNGYPQPEDNNNYRKGITYSDENSCTKCSSGFRQVDSFRIKKQPRWGRKGFFMLNWVPDELFVSDKAKILLEKAGFTGISFIPVKNKSGTDNVSDVWQLNIPFYLPKGIVTEGTMIKEINICPDCGDTKYLISCIGMHKYKKETFENAPDFAKTYESFGHGHYLSKNIVVNQKVYRLLRDNKLDRALEFQPIELV